MAKLITLEPSEQKAEGLMGTNTSTVEEMTVEMLLYQEFHQRKLSQEMLLSNINILVLTFSSNQDLLQQGETPQYIPGPHFTLLVANQSGILSYIKNYWRGYFNLFLITTDTGAALEKSMKENLEKDFSHLFLCHSRDSKLDDDVLETMVRFYIHCEKYQCSKIEKTTDTDSSQSLLNPNWKCSGLCGLRNKEVNLLKKKKRSVIQVIRRKLSRNEA